MTKPIEYINAITEHMFHTDNDRLMMRAFLFRRILNKTPLEVGKELKISRIKVNQIIQTIPYRRLDSEKFNKTFKECLEVCSIEYTQKLRTDHINHLNHIKSRLSNKYKAAL